MGRSTVLRYNASEILRTLNYVSATDGRSKASPIKIILQMYGELWGERVGGG